MSTLITRLLAPALLFLTLSPAHASEPTNEQIEQLSVQMFAVQGKAKTPIVNQLAELNDKSLIPTFVLAMRWTGGDTRVAKALSDLTGEKISNWHQAYAWQERHPEIIPHKTYRDVKLRFLGNTDVPVSYTHLTLPTILLV